MMKYLLRSSPSTISSLPSETTSVLKLFASWASTGSGTREKSGTLRNDSDGNEATPSLSATLIRSALLNSTLVRFTRYVPPCTLTQGSIESSHRGVMDCIFGDVFVVVARFLATEVVTLRCSRDSDMID